MTLSAPASPVNPELLSGPLFALVVGWFDPLFLFMLGLGFWLGRRRGASQEYFAVGQWFLFAVMGGLMSRALGKLMAKWLGMGLYGTSLLGYVVGGGLVLIAAAMLRTYNVHQMLDAQFFGKAETPAGGGLGLLKWFAILLIPLAVLHARKVPDPAAPRTLHDRVHVLVCDRSLTGAALEKAGAFLLIPESTEARRATVGQKKTQQMNNAGK